MLTRGREATPEQLQSFLVMAAIVKKTYPDWGGKLLTPEASVKAVLGVVDKAGRESTGAVLSHWGNKKWV